VGMVQPGARAPAPGDLRLVQAFVNTHYDLEQEQDADLLATPTAAHQWLAASGMLEQRSRVSKADLERLLRLRDTLRGLARANGSDTGATPAATRPQSLNVLAHRAPVEIRFDDGGPRFTGASGDVAGAIGLLLALTAQAILDGTWRRLKVCPGPHCDWAFYDHSRNQTSRWCSMAVCGGRTKARRHYRRRRGQAP
jgi:predicted RNA-binding Zn ribbon-like protein